MVNVESFKDDVFEEDQQKNLFDSFKKEFESEKNLVIRNQFDVSEQVVNKENVITSYSIHYTKLYEA